MLFPIDHQVQGLVCASVRQCLSVGDHTVVVYVVRPSSPSSSGFVANYHYYQ